MNVAAWLRELGLECYIRAFEDNHVDARTLGLLTEADLTDFGVKSVGHRRKLAQAIAALADKPMAPAQPAVVPPHAEAERRQLSVLYCEMVEPAAASGLRLDSEDRRELIRRFHRTCTDLVLDHDGHVANFYGDCLLAYFGWPRAHEDDTERAARAGLALARQRHASQAGVALSARVGMATGAVVVGNLIHVGPAQEQSAVGLAPNLAARLLGLAAPGQVVIDELTRRLLAPSFAVQPLGSHALKGISEPVAAYAIRGERATASRFDAHRGGDLAPMVGRDQELALLLERWAQAQGGEGTAVMLMGEAGIGKSRIARAVLDACAAQPYSSVRWQCSPHHMGSALWPVIQQLGREAGLDAQDTPEAALDKLETLTGPHDEARAVYATLLGLDGRQRYGPPETTPQVLRERTLELLVERLIEMAEQRPLLLVVEDAHWIDPTTLELVHRHLQRIDHTRTLMLITSRPDQQPALGKHPSVTELSLSRLGRSSVEAIVARLGGDTLLAHTRAMIVAQSDGVPLFVEELTKAVLETGEASIPASLHGSLMARLDRTPGVKEIAQIAACIGREFDQVLLQAVVERPEVVEAAVDKLAAAELIFRHSDKTNPRLTFKHALVQEAAYESLLRSKRQAIHARILDVLEARGTDSPPEILAHHAQLALQTDKAIGYWSQAGNSALAKSAYLEAANYLDSAIRLIQDKGVGAADWRARELRLQIALGQARMASFGYGAEVTRRSFERARELLDITQDTTLRVPVLYGLWSGHIMAVGTHAALRMGFELLQAGQADADEQAILVAHRLVGSAHLERGEWAEARSHLEHVLHVYDRDASLYRGLSARYGMDPAASACGNLAVAAHVAGFPEQGMQLAARVRDMGCDVAHAIARAPMYCECVNLAILRRDPQWMARDGEVFTMLATENRLAMWRAYAIGMGAWRLLEGGRPVDAIEGFRHGLAELTRCSARVRIQLYQLGLAIALGRCGQLAQAIDTVDDALHDSARTGQHWLDAELWRVRGQLGLDADSGGDDSQAVRDLQRALDVARAQGALSWELRAATSLARHRAKRGERAQARDLLAPIYGSFTEGFDTADLVEARTLLSELTDS